MSGPGLDQEIQTRDALMREKLARTKRVTKILTVCSVAQLCQNQFQIPCYLLLAAAAHGYAAWFGYTRGVSQKRITALWLVGFALSGLIYFSGLLQQIPPKFVIPDPDNPFAQLTLLKRAAIDMVRVLPNLLFALYAGQTFFRSQLLELKEQATKRFGLSKLSLKARSDALRPKLLRLTLAIALAVATSMVVRMFTSDWLIIGIAAFTTTSILALVLRVNRTPLWFRALSMVTFIPVQSTLIYHLMSEFRELSRLSQAAGGFDDGQLLTSPQMWRIAALELVLTIIVVVYMRLRKAVTKPSVAETSPTVSEGSSDETTLESSLSIESDPKAV